MPIRLSDIPDTEEVKGIRLSDIPDEPTKIRGIRLSDISDEPQIKGIRLSDIPDPLMLTKTLPPALKYEDIAVKKAQKLIEPLTQTTHPYLINFPALMTQDLIDMYRPSNIALAEMTGGAFGQFGREIGKVMPKAVKKRWVYRFGQPEAYQNLAEERIFNIGKGMEKAKEIGQSLTKGFTQGEQLRLGQIMKGGITTVPKYKEVTEPARKIVDELSGQLIKQGIPSDKTAEIIKDNLGLYLPRLYRTKEVEKSLGALFGLKKPARIDLSRLKYREEIPLEVRTKMGEIKEAGYPTAKAIGQMTQMTETAKLFNSVADNPEWASEIAKEGFTKMPDVKTLGKLRGKWVSKNIADDINDIIEIQPNWYKTYKNILTAWKAGKTILNPATHSRNMMSNTFLLDMSGVNHVQQMKLLPQALKDMIGKGKYYQEAKKSGLLGNEYYATELKSLIDSFPVKSKNPIDFVLNLVKGSYNKAGNIYQAEEQWFKLAKFISEREKGKSILTAKNEAEKWLFNYNKVTPFIRKTAESPFGIPFIRFTYKALPRIAETVTKNPLKIYKYIALAKSIETASAKTLGMSDEELKEAKSLLPEWLKGLGKYALLLPTKDKNSNLQYLDLTYILPLGMLNNLTDASGALGMLNNPALIMTGDLTRNKQSFSGKEIWKNTDTNIEKTKKITDYIYKQVMPSLALPIPTISKGGYSWQKLQSAIQNRPDYFGRKKSIKSAVMDILGGLKITPLDVDQQRYFQTLDKQREYNSLKKDIYSILNNQGLTDKEASEALDIIYGKMEDIWE